MESPIQFTWRGLEHHTAHEDALRAQAEKLLKFDPSIERIRVMVERSSHRHKVGDLYHVRVLITGPGADVVVTRDPQENHAHEDLGVCVRDAFQTARRQLQDRVSIRHGKVKRHTRDDDL